MQTVFLKSKIHRIFVTQADRDYAGSLTIDEDLMDAAGISRFEKILCANVDNGERFETYAIKGPRGSGTCCLNGAAAFKGKPGDRLIVMAWCLLSPEEAAAHSPRIVVIGGPDNKPAA